MSDVVYEKVKIIKPEELKSGMYFMIEGKKKVYEASYVIDADYWIEVGTYGKNKVKSILRINKKKDTVYYVKRIW